ncbi:MAG: hypothetical protein Q9219_004759 [cf. Caloplaca sp. 3 TL-2023]
MSTNPFSPSTPPYSVIYPALSPTPPFTHEFLMDYFINDMLGSSRRGGSTTKSVTATPEPRPLPPVPTLTRNSRKNNKSNKIPESQADSAAAAESSKKSKAPEVALAAGIPLPDTPVPPKTATSGDEEELVSPKSRIRNVGESDYFSPATMAPPAAKSFQEMPDHPSMIEVPDRYTPIPELSPPGQRKRGAALGDKVESTKANDHHLKVTALDDEKAYAVTEMPGERDNSPPPSLQISHTPEPVVHNQRTILIGLSGSPASGKTTLAHLLSSVLPPTTPSFIINQNDFFIRKHLLIPGSDGEVGVSYRRTVDFTAFKKLISHSKRQGGLPSGFRSLQHDRDREAALSRVSPEVLDQVRTRLAQLPYLHRGCPIGIVDGFFLYHSETIRNTLDIKLLLRSTRSTARTRQFEKLHAEEWKIDQGKHPWDTIEYFDRVTWQNYADEHAVLFEDHDVEGAPVQEICQGVGISVQPNLYMDLGEVLQWVVHVFGESFEKTVVSHENKSDPAADWRQGDDICSCDEGFLGRIRRAICDRL